jgi:hypothetical protein
MSKLATQIPFIGKTIKVGKELNLPGFNKKVQIQIPGADLIGKSSRAYAGFLNKLRADVFAGGVDALQAQGKTPENSLEEYRSWADFVNNATGRGKMPGKTLEDSAPLLNAMFFSPKFLASRLNLMTEIFEQEGAGEAAKTSIPALFGIGVQNYGPRQKKKAPEKVY